MRTAVGAVYQTVTCCSCSNPVPALGVELGLVDDAGDAVGQRRDDAVGGAGDPSGIGGAPENVVGMKVEGELAGHVMGDDRLMHVHRALGLAGGAAGEMEQRQVLGIGRRDRRNRSSASAIS